MVDDLSREVTQWRTTENDHVRTVGKRDLRATNIASRARSCSKCGSRILTVFVPGEQTCGRAGGNRGSARAGFLDTMAVGLSNTSVSTRFTGAGRVAGAIVVADYEAFRPDPRDDQRRAQRVSERRIVALFSRQLYRHSRFRARVGESLLVADVAIVSRIYAARESRSKDYRSCNRRCGAGRGVLEGTCTWKALRGR